MDDITRLCGVAPSLIDTPEFMNRHALPALFALAPYSAMFELCGVAPSLVDTPEFMNRRDASEL